MSPRARMGGALPDIKYGLEMTVEPPTGVSAAAPVEQFEVLVLTGLAADGTGYKVATPAAGATLPHSAAPGVILVAAKHRIDDPTGVLGVKVLGPWQQVIRIRYNAADGVPVVGQSIVTAAGNPRRISGVAFNGSSYICHVDTVAQEVEVLC